MQWATYFWQCRGLNVKVTVVDKRDATLHLIGASRALVDESYAHKLWVRQGTVKKIHQNYAVLDNGEVTSFDYLVIATGASYSEPIVIESNNREEAVAKLSSYWEALCKTRIVLIIGGGPLGVELAVEIFYTYPSKKVTLVHPREKLLSDIYPNNIKASAASLLQNHGVHLVLGDRLVMPESLPPSDVVQERVFSTVKGKDIHADLHYLCTGAKIVTDFLPTSTFESKKLLDSKTGEIQVRKTLQVDHPELTHIFAVGIMPSD
ncbi:uncharacterized protein VTP21DRAFT_918 [Calcarisporiella thermophila]|uniref:uncharacterized protein n=1 Tax=Calcarisporiella thermophila TaxID=911321 RepID=UPI003742D2A7